MYKIGRKLARLMLNDIMKYALPYRCFVEFTYFDYSIDTVLVAYNGAKYRL